MKLRDTLVIALAVAIVVAFASTAQADTYKNKKTGETIKGKLTESKINDKRVFKLDAGGSKFLNPAEWELVEVSDAPAKTDAATDVATAGTPAADAAAVDKTRVYVLPIKGGIASRALVRGVIKALEEAKKNKCTVIVFHIDTPGGRVDVADDLIQLIEKIDWARTATWVEGNGDKGAISAGAYISLATEMIFMAGGTTLGGAVPWSRDIFGNYEVDQKMQSIFRARFRALAGKRGYPVALADAMVDSSTSVVQVFVDGKQQLVSEEEATQLQKDNKGDQFRRGKTIVRQGKILTLTADEAVEYGVSRALANDVKELMSRMEIPDYLITSGDWVTEWVNKTATDEKARFEKAKLAYTVNFRQARETDPSYALWSYQRGTTQWKNMALQSMSFIKTAAAALSEIEKLVNDPNCDRYMDKTELDEWKADLQAMYQRIEATK